MNQPKDANERVACFEIILTRYLNTAGQPLAVLPDWAADPDRLRSMYRSMVRTRAFDKKAVALHRTGQLGTYAACLGQEAVGTAVGMVLRADDVYIPAYREYAAQFLRGVSMTEILLYWGGDERGMDYAADSARQDYPLSVPIATQVPHAIGVAYAFRLRKQDRVVLVSCGDGATSKGDFYEAVSSAKLWNLPIVFLVTNNQWAISLPRDRQTGAQTLAQKGLAGGITGQQVDGNDAIATYEILNQAISAARAGEGPQLVEAITYRLHDHTTADDARRYRGEDEVKAAWARCPIKRLRAYLESKDAWSASDEESLQSEAVQAAESAAQAFIKLEPEPPETIFDHLYAELPSSMRWQREQVAARGPLGGTH